MQCLKEEKNENHVRSVARFLFARPSATGLARFFRRGARRPGSVVSVDHASRGLLLATCGDYSTSCPLSAARRTRRVQQDEEFSRSGALLGCPPAVSGGVRERPSPRDGWRRSHRARADPPLREGGSGFLEHAWYLRRVQARLSPSGEALVAATPQPADPFVNRRGLERQRVPLLSAPAALVVCRFAF